MSGEYFEGFSPFLEIVGAVSICFMTLKVGAAVFRLLSRTVRRWLFPVDVKKYGQWAVVTGATGGIGKSYAFKLAERGMDIVLISRSADKLSDVAAQIRDQHQVSVKVIVADFKRADIYPDIKQKLSALDIGILVNNVGIASDTGAGYFCEVADNVEQFYKDMVNVNIMSCVMMTTAVLPGMLDRKRGAIINISSLSGSRPLPFFTTYAATKVFIRFFSEALHMEYSSQGITVQAVTPSLVYTAMGAPIAEAANIPKGLMCPSSDFYVTSALRTLGHESTTTAYWPHELQGYMFGCMPDFIVRRTLLEQRDIGHKTK